jgi:hypothetical protein
MVDECDSIIVWMKHGSSEKGPCPNRLWHSGLLREKGEAREILTFQRAPWPRVYKIYGNGIFVRGWAMTMDPSVGIDFIASRRQSEDETR